MSEHGFLKPNPVLFDLERLKPRSQLGHEVGLGGERNIVININQLTRYESHI